MRADGTVDSYAIGFGYPGFTDCQVTIDNVQLNAGVAAYDGATVAMTNCSSAAGTNYYACYVEGGAKIVINDGKYTASNAKPIFYANNGSEIEVNAGQFYGEIAWTAGTGTVTIKGGTFDHDPGSYLAEGYQATKDGDVWTVSAKQG